MRRASVSVIILAAFMVIPGAPGPGPSEAAAREAGPVLHKFVLIDTAGTIPPGMSTLPGLGGSEDLPRAILEGGEVLPAPSLRRPPGLIPSPGRNAFSVPDRDTRVEDVLDYEAVFNPTVAPFKRLAVFDSVGPAPAYRFGVSDDRIVPVPVTGPRDAPDRERFWASTTLRLERGESSEVPSVAPDMRILSYRTEPPVELEFGRDGSDNFFATAPAITRKHRVRLVMLVDAPSFYFRGSVPTGKTLRDIPEALRPAVHRHLYNKARRKVLPVLDLSTPERIQLDHLLPVLVAYFRDFEPDDASPRAAGSGGDLYLDLALSRNGVCRHRAFAFVATAHAIGLPARYIANEAHAFVEVYLPGDGETPGGWRRIDLGGAARGLDVHGAGDRAVHDSGDDPFPRPERYDSTYSARAPEAPRDPEARAGFGAVRGLREAGRAGAPLAGARSPTGTDAGRTPGATSGSGPGPAWSDPAADSVPGRSDPHSRRGDVTPDRRPPTRLSLNTHSRTVLRGDAVRVTGALHNDEGEGIYTETVVFFLVRDGYEVRLGSTVTNVDGTYDMELVIPASMSIGRYEVEAFFPGNVQNRPTVTD